MSYLRNHMRHFVLPGIHTLARHGHRGPLTAVDIKPREKQVRPSTKCKYVEAGLLYSLVSSVLKKGDPTREIALGLCRQVGRAKDAEFVYAIDTRGGIKKLGEKYDGVEGSDVLHSMLCNSMRRLKRKMRRQGSLLLPGRDVWCWEVMARKLTVPSTFDARVSRSVAWNQKALRTCIDDWQIQDWKDVLFFDTGFAGSIPKAIAQAEGLPNINMLLLSSGVNQHQIFRTHTGSRAKALAFEYLAKYFQSGTHRDGVPYQELNALDEFIKAALLTIWLWYHISPTRLPSYRDKKLSPATLAQYKKGIDQSNFGTLTVQNDGLISAPYVPLTATDDTFMPVTGTSSTQPIYLTANSSGATTTTVDWAVSNTSTASSISALSTLDQLWGAGTSGQLLLDKSPPPPTMLQQMQKEMDKQIVQDLVAKAHGDTPKNWKPAPKKIKPLILNPETFTVHDPKTGVNVEVAEDVKAVLKGAQPTEEGFELGQYPGPPIVNEQLLKLMAGMDPNAPGVPDVDLSIEMDSHPSVAGGHPVAFKKTTLTKPDGSKKIIKTPITG